MCCHLASHAVSISIEKCPSSPVSVIQCIEPVYSGHGTLSLETTHFHAFNAAFTPQGPGQARARLGGASTHGELPLATSRISRWMSDRFLPRISPKLGPDLTAGTSYTINLHVDPSRVIQLVPFALQSSTK